MNTIAEKINAEARYHLERVAIYYEVDDLQKGIARYTSWLLCNHANATETQPNLIKCEDCGANICGRWAGPEDFA